MAISLKQLSPDYELLVAGGRTTWPSDAHLSARDAEWIPQAKLGDPRLFYCDPIPHLLPFAVTGGHDLWCWRLDVSTGLREFEIILCPRDSEIGARWAPRFSAWAFRKAVEEATTVWDAEEESRLHLSAWAACLRDLGHEGFAGLIEEISARPLRERSAPDSVAPCFIDRAEYEELVCQFVGAAYWEAPIRWMAD